MTLAHQQQGMICNSRRVCSLPKSLTSRLKHWMKLLINLSRNHLRWIDRMMSPKYKAYQDYKKYEESSTRTSSHQLENLANLSLWSTRIVLKERQITWTCLAPLLRERQLHLSNALNHKLAQVTILDQLMANVWCLKAQLTIQDASRMTQIIRLTMSSSNHWKACMMTSSKELVALLCIRKWLLCWSYARSRFTMRNFTRLAGSYLNLISIASIKVEIKLLVLQSKHAQISTQSTGCMEMIKSHLLTGSYNWISSVLKTLRHEWYLLLTLLQMLSHRYPHRS